ncbi:hypothetical protein ACFQZ4_24070 [Catellatospora coxensis]|uniref:Uncharacterized protein n=1 Tax=Catellatospora coxensis TaxID=310354 RepID=A0A8J3KWY7_9ACTN|nr:hypothetical protein [Catellatospora coxensis]GIG10193.1 hypothetical protein Cco03nite_68930 [Catellatospora coxensis]
MSALPIGRYRNADALFDAVQLTPENGPQVWEWADSKPFFDPDGTITGLTIYTPFGRVKANFGDWIVLDPKGGFFPVEADLFAAVYSDTAQEARA